MIDFGNEKRTIERKEGKGCILKKEGWYWKRDRNSKVPNTGKSAKMRG